MDMFTTPPKNYPDQLEVLEDEDLVPVSFEEVQYAIDHLVKAGTKLLALGNSETLLSFRADNSPTV